MAPPNEHTLFKHIHIPIVYKDKRMKYIIVYMPWRLLRLGRALAKQLVNQADLITSGSRSVICQSHWRCRPPVVDSVILSINY